MSDPDLESFDAGGVEFVFERGVGMTIYTSSYTSTRFAVPWLSWDETKQLAAWLNEQIKQSEQSEEPS